MASAILAGRPRRVVVMVLQPVGPLPASTYWRRRLVLLVVLVVLLLLAKSCVGGGSAKPAGTTAVPTPTPTASTTASATPSPTAGTTPVVAAGTCPDSALRVTARAEAKEYPIGSSPRFVVTVTNTSASPCRRDLGPGAVELVVSSGNDRIWSSDDCSASKGSEVLTLKAGASLEKPVTWSGKRSSKGCPTASPRPAAKAGYYRVVARVGTLRSAPAVFRLRGA